MSKKKALKIAIWKNLFKTRTLTRQLIYKGETLNVLIERKGQFTNFFRVIVKIIERKAFFLFFHFIPQMLYRIKKVCLASLVVLKGLNFCPQFILEPIFSLLIRVPRTH